MWTSPPASRLRSLAAVPLAHAEARSGPPMGGWHSSQAPPARAARLRSVVSSCPAPVDDAGPSGVDRCVGADPGAERQGTPLDWRRNMLEDLVGTLAVAAALTFAAGPAMATAASPQGPAPYTCVGGEIPSGNYASITVTGVCSVAARCRDQRRRQRERRSRCHARRAERAVDDHRRTQRHRRLRARSSAWAASRPRSPATRHMSAPSSPEGTPPSPSTGTSPSPTRRRSVERHHGQGERHADRRRLLDPLVDQEQHDRRATSR